MIRKCLFPVAGYGTRFLPATKSMPKEMLPIVNKPLVQYGVEEAAAAAESTEEQARSLVNSVSLFKLSDDGRYDSQAIPLLPSAPTAAYKGEAIKSPVSLKPSKSKEFAKPVAKPSVDDDWEEF